jgi:hypothetical protein
MIYLCITCSRGKSEKFKGSGIAYLEKMIDRLPDKLSSGKTNISLLPAAAPIGKPEILLPISIKSSAGHPDKKPGGCVPSLWD